MIRHANPSDRDELVRMRQALWPDSAPAEVDAVLAASRQGLRAVLVYMGASGELGGFAEVGTRAYAEGCTSSPVAYLEGIWVDPDVRREGVASAMVEAAESWARGSGLEEFASDTSITNEGSQAFHEHCGFEEIERAVCYRKVLRSDRSAEG